MKFMTAAQALELVNSGERIFIHGGAATPSLLVNALTARAGELRNVEITHLHTEGEAAYAQEMFSTAFRVNCFFVGANLRPYIGQANVQYIPVSLSEVPDLFRKGILPLDTALLQVSEPDEQGYCSLGVSVDIARAAADSAKKIIALVNPNMPRTQGDGQLHVSRIDAAVFGDEPLFEQEPASWNPVISAIGRNAATLIEDGATLQLGIGNIPDAVLGFLQNHRDLGIHTELISEGVLPLVESGVINGSRKKNQRGKIVASFAMGTRRLYDFLHDNPLVKMLDIGYVNDPAVIAENNHAVSINGAIEIDLTGQVCADSIGTTIYSGVGGQLDFVRGASMSRGGKSIIAMPSTTGSGLSKIVPMLKPGAGVVTPRAQVHYVVTEHGIADLYGKNLSQRARELISIVHPDHREELSRSCHECYGWV